MTGQWENKSIFCSPGGRNWGEYGITRKGEGRLRLSDPNEGAGGEEIKKGDEGADGRVVGPDRIVWMKMASDIKE